MAYSRWLTSRWYTYHLASDARTREQRVFGVCGVCEVTYGDMLKDFDAVLNEIVRLEGLLVEEAKVVTMAEKAELASYMRAFMENVEQEFPASVGRQRSLQRQNAEKADQAPG